MRVGFLNYYEFFNDNKMFKDPSAIMLSDDLAYPFVKLYENANLKGINLSTVDTQPLESYDLIFVLDFPKSNNQYFKKLIESGFENLILLIYECEIVMPDNWDKENYKYFKKIFTWHDGLWIMKKYLNIIFQLKFLKLLILI